MRRFRSSCGIEARSRSRASTRPAGRRCAGRGSLVGFLAWLVFASAAACAGEPGLRTERYAWHPEVAPQGPLVIVVSLDEQRLYVYRNGVAIGDSAISSGRSGHETPSGIFTILQKDRDHRSNKYDDAPMPYMERLTWDGVAMHGGTLPGYPASHGCVRLPHDFARRLFAITSRGDTVVVANGATSPLAIVHPSVLAPVTPRGLAADLRHPADAYRWDESVAPPGPLSVVVSVPDRRVHVFREGIRIGTSRLDVAEGFVFRGAVVFVLLQDPGSAAPAAAVPTRRWAMYRLRGEGGQTPSMDELAARLKGPDEFASLVAAQLRPGTSVLVVDRPATAVDSASAIQPRTVLESEAPGTAKLGASR